MAKATDETTKAVGTAEEVDTSTTAGQADVDYDSDDIFDDIDTSDAETVDDSEEDAEKEATDSKDDSGSEAEADVGDEEQSEDSNQEDAEKQETDPKAEQQRLAYEARKAREAERQARKEADDARRAAREAELDRYLKEAENDEDELRQRQIDVREYRLKEKAIDLNSQVFESEMRQAVATIDLLKSPSKTIQNRLERALQSFVAANIVQDDQGRPVELKGSVLEHLQAEAAAIRQEQEELRAELTASREKAKTNQTRRTLKTPSRAPVKQTDEGQDAFDQEAGKY